MDGVMVALLSKIKIIVFAFVFWGLFSGLSLGSTVQQKAYFLAKKAEQYSRQDNKQLAVSYINKAIKLQPANKQLYYRRAFILGRAGMYSAAIQEFSSFVRMKQYSYAGQSNAPVVQVQKYPHAVRFRGDCFMAISKPELAAKDYLSFLRSHPKDGKVWTYLVEAYVLMGDRRSALSAIAKGLETDSHWSWKLEKMRSMILANQKIEPHEPLSN